MKIKSFNVILFIILRRSLPLLLPESLITKNRLRRYALEWYCSLLKKGSWNNQTFQMRISHDWGRFRSFTPSHSVLSTGWGDPNSGPDRTRKRAQDVGCSYDRSRKLVWSYGFLQFCPGKRFEAYLTINDGGVDFIWKCHNHYALGLKSDYVCKWWNGWSELLLHNGSYRLVYM